MSGIAAHNLLYSCEERTKRGNEQFVAEHALGFLLSGESLFHTAEGTVLRGPGSIGLIRRNQLAKTVKVPGRDGQPFKSIHILLDQAFLQAYAAEIGMAPQAPYSGPGMIDLGGDVFLQGFFASLLPFYERPEAMTAALAQLKTREAIALLLRADPKLQQLLFDFSAPHKIDLEAYMNRHFMFNIPMARFAQLTGRSLATFKRDFSKQFGRAPEQWLQQKRLEQAHFLISQRGQQVSEVYHEVGFENLSHFSRSFKQFYGYTPSSVQAGSRL
jgi:AraC-like DNA-binding protein